MNYVIGASRSRRRSDEVIANRCRFRGRWLDGNPIGRIRLARFAAPGGDGRVCDPRVLGVIAPQRLHPPPVLVFFGPLDHSSQKTQIRSSSRAWSLYAPRASFWELAIRGSSLPRGVLQTRRWPGSWQRGSTSFSSAVRAPPRIFSLSRGCSSNWNSNSTE